MVKPLEVGDRVPPFSLSDQDGALFSSADALAKGPLVVFFYPKDDTRVCTKEACAFRDARADFAAVRATVVGVSGDSVASHRSFATSHGLGYPLLADAGNRVRSEVFGVPRDLLGLAAGRATYVIDVDGVIRMRFQAPLEANEHVTRALAVIRRLADKA
jgi:thioredoxin-dependent peroxiredoxin